MRGAFAASGEQFAGGFEFALPKKDLVSQCPINGLVIDLYVGEVAEQRRCLGVLPSKRVDPLAKRIGLFAELGADVRGKLDADGRHARCLGDERFGRFVCLAKRGDGEAKRHDDACRDAAGR